MKMSFWSYSGMALATAGLLIAVWPMQSRWHRWELTHYETFRIDAPGISDKGLTICKDGCEMMQGVNSPVLLNGKRLDSFAGVSSHRRYCSVLEFIDHRDRFSEGGVIIYDSCSKN